LLNHDDSETPPDISLNHWHGTISFALAKVYFEQGNFVAAEPLFEAVVNNEEPPDFDFDFYFEPTFQLAITYQRQRKNSQAEPLFLRCIEFLEPSIEENSAENRHMNDVVLNAYIALLRSSNRHTEADKVALRLSKNLS
jgi:tetratricopeptide (TPR) repeat protein